MRRDVHIYISGRIGNGMMPTQGQLNAAAQKFEAAETIIRSMGYLPINPLKQGFTSLMSYVDVLDYCKNIIRTRSRGVFMLKDWSESYGAKEEHKEAIYNSIPVYYESQGGYHTLEYEANYKYNLKQEEEVL